MSFSFNNLMGSSPFSSFFGSNNSATNFLDNGFNSLLGDNGLFTNYEGAWDKFKNGNTNEVNKEIANENLKYQRENLDYQKALQQKIFEREDSAYARTVADMRSAGLSPLTMQSTNGAGEAIQTDPLHNDYQHQGAGFGDLANYAFQLNSAIQTSKYNTAEINNINSQTDAQNITNSFLPANLAVNLVGQLLNNKNISESTRNLVAQRGLTMLQTLEQSYKNSILKNDLKDSNRWETYASLFGISKNMSEKERYLAFAKQLFKSTNDKPSSEKSDPVFSSDKLSRYLETEKSHNELMKDLENAIKERAKQIQSWFLGD